MGMSLAPTPVIATSLGAVKSPTRDVTNLEDLVPVESAESIAQLLFENFSGIELAQVLTTNTIDGIDQQYSIISNLSEIRRIYDATRSLTIMDKFSPIFNVFAIDLVEKIPTELYILKNGLDETYSYLEYNGASVGSLVEIEKGSIYPESNGDLVIEFDNMKDDELIEVQILVNGTIYVVKDDN